MAKANSNNTIEEFFISIGIDASQAKNASKEVQKIQKELDKQRKEILANDKKLGKQKKDLRLKEAREQIAIERAIKKRQWKEIDDKVRADIAEIKASTRKLDVEGSIQKARRKQAVDEITHKDAVFSKMSDYYKGLEKSSAKEYTAQQKIDTAKKKSWEEEQKRKAKNRRQREEDRRTEEANLRKGLMTRLKDYKAQKAKLEKDRVKEIKQQIAVDRAIQKRQLKEINDRVRAETAAIKARERLRQKELRQQQRAQDVADTIYRKAAYKGLAPDAKREKDNEITRLIGQGDIKGLKDLSAQISQTTAAMKRHTRATIGLHTAQLGLYDSTRNMIRSYASLYALFEGTAAIKNVGMDFQSMEVGLAAVVGEGKAARDELEFLRQESNRLGFDLAKTSKSYVKLYAAAEGKASNEEIRKGFISLMEAATVFQLTQEDTERAMKAVQQMFSKTGIYAEELY